MYKSLKEMNFNKYEEMNLRREMNCTMRKCEETWDIYMDTHNLITPSRMSIA